MAVERSIEIARPPEEVFAFLADARNDPRWCASVIACDSASAQANSSLKTLPPCTPSDELPSSSNAVVTSRLLGSRSRKMRGSSASPVVRSM